MSAKSLQSTVQLCATLWTAACQARILEWIAVPLLQGIFPGIECISYISCTGRQVLKPPKTNRYMYMKCFIFSGVININTK